jgi:hypothetical protein
MDSIALALSPDISKGHEAQMTLLYITSMPPFAHHPETPEVISTVTMRPNHYSNAERRPSIKTPTVSYPSSPSRPRIPSLNTITPGHRLRLSHSLILIPLPPIILPQPHIPQLPHPLHHIRRTPPHTSLPNHQYQQSQSAIQARPKRDSGPEKHDAPRKV